MSSFKTAKSPSNDGVESVLHVTVFFLWFVLQNLYLYLRIEYENFSHLLFFNSNWFIINIFLSVPPLYLHPKQIYIYIYVFYDSVSLCTSNTPTCLSVCLSKYHMQTCSWTFAAHEQVDHANPAPKFSPNVPADLLKLWSDCQECLLLLFTR